MYLAVYHCVRSVCIRSYSGPYFHAFGLNMERYGVSLRIQSEYAKIGTRITPNKETFHVVHVFNEKTITSKEGKYRMERKLRFIKLMTRMWDILNMYLVAFAKSLNNADLERFSGRNNPRLDF